MLSATVRILTVRDHEDHRHDGRWRKKASFLPRSEILRQRAIVVGAGISLPRLREEGSEQSPYKV
jgi:hypothetical protein